MQRDEFSRRFNRAVAAYKVSIGQDVSDAATQVLYAGLPVLGRHHITYNVMLAAAYPHALIDHDSLIAQSYASAYPWWRRLFWKIGDFIEADSRHPDPTPVLRSRD